MRVAMGYIHRGLGQNTLDAGGLTEADCESAGEILDSATGFCVIPRYAAPQDVAAAAASAVQSVNYKAAAPPVYTSSFQPSSNPQDWLQTSYGINNTAAGVAQNVNQTNAQLYQQWENAVSNWVINGSQGSPPSPPSYQTFSQVWAQQGLGPAPNTVSTSPPGTPIPTYQGTITPGTFSGSAGASAGPAVSTAVPIPTKPAAIPQSVLNAATNAPPVPAGPVAVSAPSSSPSSGSSGASGSGGGTTTNPLAFLTETSVGSIPNWVWLAGGAVLLFYFMGRK